MSRHRLDEELVAQGFFPSADDAARAVLAGEVSTSDRRLEKPGEQVKEGIELHVRGHERYVSRGGEKLAGALEAFGVDPTGLTCLDVGCSTGGFTDCLLRRGAAHVTAVDVGYAQFSWELRQDVRVELLERTNICDLAAKGRAEQFDLATCDVSFTDAQAVASAIAELLRPAGRLIYLVKPQFELPRADVGAGGIVRDPAAWEKACTSATAALVDAGFSVEARCESPITGAKGNHEFFLLATKS